MDFKKVFKLLEKLFSSLTVHRKPSFQNFRVIFMFQRIWFVQIN